MSKMWGCDCKQIVLALTRRIDMLALTQQTQQSQIHDVQLSVLKQELTHAHETVNSLREQIRVLHQKLTLERLEF
jgi:phage shock protein A